MDPNKKYFAAGLFVLLGMAGLILFGFWIENNTGPQKVYRDYQIHFSESVNGLILGSPVKFHGVEVGLVHNISIDRADSNQINVVIRVLEGTPIKKDTTATLKILGITGSCYIELGGGAAQSADLEASQPDQLPEIPARTSDLANLVNQLPDLVGKTSHLTDQANALMSDENVRIASDILQHWDHISASLDRASMRLNATLDNLQASSEAIRKFSTHADRQTQDSLGELRQTLVSVKQTSRDIDTLSRTLNANPSRLVYPDAPSGVTLP